MQHTSLPTCGVVLHKDIISGGIQIFYEPVLSQKYFFSPGSVSTNGRPTSLNGSAGLFADQIKFRAHHWI